MGVAVLVLLIGFGSVLATLLPVLGAVVGVLTGAGLLSVVAAAVRLPGEAPTLALMMGLGVGIDYALFLTTRFRQSILDGAAPFAAVAATTASSGRAVVIAALTVVLALFGLAASGIVYIGQLGLAVGVAVAVAGIAAVTLVPALLAVAGSRIDVLKVRRRPLAETSAAGGVWVRYAAVLGRRPVVFLVAAVMLLAVLALPLLGMRMGTPGVRALPVASTTRQASEAVDAGFGVGYQARLEVVVQLPDGAGSAAERTASVLRRHLAAMPGIESVTAFTPSRDGGILVGTVQPASAAGTVQTAALIGRLDRVELPRILAGTGARAFVTGSEATAVALSGAVSGSLAAIILTVVGAAILLVLLTFRSPLLALKAGIVNLISIGASFGVLVAVFQWGWGSALLGIPEGVPIVSFVPMLLFAIVFGLSMDYEVFLLVRVREAWSRGASTQVSVAHGLGSTGRIIACAALIMASVFFSFVLQSDPTVKMLAFGLGVSVLLDATVVRLVIVPCSMLLFDRANWWLPSWLDRVLPHLEP